MPARRQEGIEHPAGEHQRRGGHETAEAPEDQRVGPIDDRLAGPHPRLEHHFLDEHAQAARRGGPAGSPSGPASGRAAGSTCARQRRPRRSPTNSISHTAPYTPKNFSEVGKAARSQKSHCIHRSPPVHSRQCSSCLAAAARQPEFHYKPPCRQLLNVCITFLRINKSSLDRFGNCRRDVQQIGHHAVMGHVEDAAHWGRCSRQ